MNPTPPPFRTVRKLRFGYLMALAYGSTVLAQSNAPSIQTIEADTDRWISLQSRIAETKGQWKSEKALLESSLKLLEAERATLRQSLESNKQASDVFVANRDRLQTQVAEQREAIESLDQPLRSLEASLRSLIPQLPPPLQQEVRAHLAKLESRSEGKGASIPTRVQSLVASLTAIDRFSNTLTSSRITRPGPSGENEVSVRVLYWGLAEGYGVDDANQRAWVLTPRSGGWEWEERNDIYPSVSELIEDYENETNDPRLILLPASLD